MASTTGGSKHDTHSVPNTLLYDTLPLPKAHIASTGPDPSVDTHREGSWFMFMFRAVRKNTATEPTFLVHGGSSHQLSCYP